MARRNKKEPCRIISAFFFSSFHLPSIEIASNYYKQNENRNKKKKNRNGGNHLSTIILIGSVEKCSTLL
jgi:hypothetical protein